MKASENMIKKNKRYKVKLKRKRIKHIIYFYTVNILLFFLTFSFFSIFDLPFSVYFIYLFLIIPLIFFSFYLFYTSSFSFSEIQRIKAKLRNVIQYNKLFVIDKETNPYSFITSIMFIFYKESDYLIIEAHSSGGPYALQSSELGKKLESALDFNLIELKNNSPSYITFVFDLEKPSRLILDISSTNISTSNNIELDSNKVWNFSKVPHALISGSTGSGKTFMIYYLIFEYARRNAEIFIIDPKRSDLLNLAHCFPNGKSKIASTPNNIARLLREINQVMNNRYEVMFQSSKNSLGKNYLDFDLKPIVIVFDEVAAAMEEDKKVGKEIDSLLKQLILKGRQAGVFVILSTQKPNAEAISTVIRDQIGLRIALGQLSKNGYKMTLGDDWNELPSGETGIGKGFIYIEGNGWTLPRPYNSPYIDFNNFDYVKELSSLLNNN